MAKLSGYFQATVATITILLQLANVKSQQCTFAYQGAPCPRGMYEVYSIVNKNGQPTQRGCCSPNAKDQERMEITQIAEGCQTAACAPHHVPNSCDYIEDYVVNGTKLLFEEAYRETCSNEVYPSGFRAYCCRPNSLEQALVSTYGTEPNEFPHQAGVSVLGGVCGGTIYNKRYVVTAAHCVVDSQTKKVYPLRGNRGSNYKIIIGTNMWSNDSPQYVFGVEEVIVHEGYSKKLGSPELQKLRTGEYRTERMLRTYNDIALLRLDRDITFGPTVKALRLADKGFDPLEHSKTALIAGWGTTSSGRVVGHLQKANVILRSDERCFQLSNYRRFGELRDKLMCVGGIVDGEWSTGTGSGDSGGPAICRDGNGNPVLCGVTSFSIGGVECVLEQTEGSCYPSVFAEVGNFKEWVEQKVPEGQDEETLFNKPLYGTPVSAPHQVRVTSATGKSCGGTLIQPDIVVTAAHCIMHDEKTLLRGIKVKTSQGQTMELAGSPAVMPGYKKMPKPNIEAEQTKPGVKRVVMDDNFYENDLAILRLKQKVPGVKPDQLPRLPGPNEKPYGVAMELSAQRDGPHKELRQRNFNILDRAECQKRMNRLGLIKLKRKVSEKNICAVEQYSGGSTCDRELGGGLICEGNVLCGVQSFRLCEWALPNSFVDMSQQKSFVERAITMLRGN
ncbi:unnamed protein product [Orchesella dallaii]|uniref:Peptidase S1 domain-containing protein n=1 Tax=Orchesella dallaii TaxID=48710 RepID=A0ABP1S8J3_9HEXA